MHTIHTTHISAHTIHISLFSPRYLRGQRGNAFTAGREADRLVGDKQANAVRPRHATHAGTTHGSCKTIHTIQHTIRRTVQHRVQHATQQRPYNCERPVIRLSGPRSPVRRFDSSCLMQQSQERKEKERDEEICFFVQGDEVRTEGLRWHCTLCNLGQQSEKKKPRTIWCAHAPGSRRWVRTQCGEV